MAERGWIVAYRTVRVLLLVGLLYGSVSCVAVATGRSSVMLARSTDRPAMIGLAALPLAYVAARLLWFRSATSPVARRGADLFVLTLAIAAQVGGVALVSMVIF